MGPLYHPHQGNFGHEGPERLQIPTYFEQHPNIKRDERGSKLDMLRRREHGQHDTVGGLEDLQQVAVAAWVEVWNRRCYYDSLRHMCANDRSKMFGGVEEKVVRAAVKRVAGHSAKLSRLHLRQQ